MTNTESQVSSDLLIVGGGYVGLPLALLAASKGRRVTIFDSSSIRCEQLNNGMSGFGPSIDENLKRFLAFETLHVVNSEEFRVLNHSNNFKEMVICVPTPIREDKVPDLSFIEQALNSLMDKVTKETLVILESSTYPGTTREILLPKLMSKFKGIKESEVLLAYSPERVDPGNQKWDSSNTPRLVSGINRISLEKSANFYRNLDIPVKEVSSPEVAEAAKLFENSFRLVNISFVNEFASVMRDLGLNAIEIIEAANTKPFGIMKFSPGPGVGGHCIPVDPYYLTWWSQRRSTNFQLIEIAQKINEQMPAESVKRVKDQLGDDLQGKKILIVGITYKPGVADLRETPAEGLWGLLIEEKCTLSWWDPLVDSWKDRARWAGEVDYDLVVVVTETSLPKPVLQIGKILNLNL